MDWAEGGGGGEPPAAVAPVASADTFQLRTAYINNFNETRSLPFALTGVFSGVSVTGSGTLTQGNVSTGTFENVAALKKTSTITGTVTGTANGKTVTMPLAIVITGFTDTNYLPLGSDTPVYTVVTGLVNLPQTVKVNDTGVVFTSTSYSSSTNKTITGTSIVSYVMEPDTASTALLKLIQTDKNIIGATTSTSAVTYRMTPAGGLSRLSETALIGSDTLSITY